MRNTILIAILLTGCGSVGGDLEDLLPGGNDADGRELTSGSEPIIDPANPPACEEGDHAKSSDGCNHCHCDADGHWACTEKACEQEPSSACVDSVPDDLAAAINQAYEDNQAARNLAVAAEQSRLNVEPLTATTVIATGVAFETMILPETDPYPNSVVAVGDAHDIRTDGYEINHGKMGMTRIYETAPGSGTYFIVDRIGGDGIGGNGALVVAENTEYGLMSVREDSDAGLSYHSWHVSPENFLVRATQAPIDNLVQSINVCGCGPMGYEVDRSGGASARGRAPWGGVARDYAQPAYSIGIFLLPGNQLPQMGAEDEFEAEFERTYYKRIYTPSKGKECRGYEVVC